jgi:hypothetical protein
MPNVSAIALEELRQLLDYDSETGVLSWAEPTRSWFASRTHWEAYQLMKANKPPFSTEQSGGYKAGRVGGQILLAHRVAWAYHYGAWPTENIDHINQNKTDNCISNLRDVPQSENAKNQCRRSNNTSGVTGVYWAAKRKKWAAAIALPGGKCVALGRYDTLAEAAAVRKAAEKKYGFHENHGRDKQR